MRIQGVRPAGPWLTRGSNIKLKGIMQVLKNADIGNGGWNIMWTTGWDWDGWLKPGIDKVVSLGANCIKIVPPNENIMSGGKFTPDVADRIRKWLDYTASVGLYAHLSIQVGAGTLDQRVAMATEVARIVGGYQHVNFLSLEGEHESVFGTDPTYVAAARASIRQFSDIPLTTGFASEMWPVPSSSSMMTNLAPYVDLWEFHPYEGVTPVPTVAQALAFRSHPLWKPYVFGETGTPMIANANAWPFGQDVSRAHWQSVGDTAAADPDCFGAIGFSLTDFDANMFGVFTESLAGAGKSYITDPFASWVSVR